ncbi:MAG: FtsX-like permease family protein [Bacteroidales bacterium]|jgi:putative ABC transport system permease protein|nr:FtsX-like permease family protein [Bacteroidales bacterium]
MEIIKIAWRNIWRNPTRSLVVIIAVCFGMVGGGFSTAVMVGAVNQRIEKAINNESSHFQIHKKGFLDNPEIGNYMSDVNAFLPEILKKPFVEAGSSRLKIDCSIASPYQNTGAILLAINPEDEIRVTELENAIVEGDFFKTDGKNQVILSSSMADKLKLKMRSKPVLTFLDVNADLTGGAFRVAGIYHTDNQMFDDMHIFVKRADFESIAGFIPTDAHEIALRFTDNENLTSRSEEIQAILPESIDGKNWKAINPDLGMMNMMTEQFLWYLVAIIMFALAFGIINTMLMSILERKKELGMLMAVGMHQGKIRRMIIWETIFLTLIGSFAGLLINQILVSLTAKNGINLSAYAEGFSSFGFSAVLYPEISLNFYLQIVALVIVTALVAAIFPIIRAGKMKPAEIISSN